MSRKLATIQTISKLDSIEGKDKIKLASILGWKVIVDSSIQEGSNVVFIEVDSVLPVKPEFEFLRKRCYSESQGGFVIKTMKMAGVISQGIVFNIKDVISSDNKLNIGNDVTDLIGIKQRIDNADLELVTSNNKKSNFINKLLNRFALYRYIKNITKLPGGFPIDYISKSDETRIQSLGNKFLKANENKEYIETEKLEGQSITYLVKRISILKFKKLIDISYYSFAQYSRNIKAQSGSKIDIYAKKNDICNKLINILRDRPDLKYISIQGELIGPGIQGNIYNLKDYALYIFKIAYNNHEMNWKQIVEICNTYKLQHVPLLGSGVLNSEKLEAEYWSNKSTNNSMLDNNILREGIVIRSAEVNELGFTDFSFKAVSPEYCLKRGY